MLILPLGLAAQVIAVPVGYALALAQWWTAPLWNEDDAPALSPVTVEAA